MNGTEALIAVLGVGLTITSGVVYQTWLTYRIAEKKMRSHAELESKSIEARLLQSQEETRRLEIMRMVSEYQGALRADGTPFPLPDKPPLNAAEPQQDELLRLAGSRHPKAAFLKLARKRQAPPYVWAALLHELQRLTR